MSTVGSFSRHEHFDELNSPLDTAEGVLSPEVRKARAMTNLMGGSFGTAVADSANISTSESIDGNGVVTVNIDLNDFVIGPTDDSAALASGALIYTLPAGDIEIRSSSMVGAMANTGTPTTDTPEIGIGNVVGSGANATLGAVNAGCENICGPIVATNIAGTANQGMTNAVSGLPIIIPSASPHAIYLNMADTWADMTPNDSPVTYTGVIQIRYRVIP